MTERRDDARDPRYRLTRRDLMGGAAGAAAALGFGRGLGGVQLMALAQDGESAILIGTLGEANTLNPFIDHESEADWRSKMLFDEFVRPDPATYAATPGIAASWEINDLA